MLQIRFYFMYMKIGRIMLLKRAFILALILNIIARVISWGIGDQLPRDYKIVVSVFGAMIIWAMVIASVRYFKRRQAVK